MLIEGRLDGIGRFSFEMLKRITQNQPDVHFVFLFDREISDEFIFSDNITPIILSPQARHPILYRIWFDWSVRSLLNQMKPDLFFSPDGFLSLGARCPQLPVIHDINFFHYPKDLKWAYSRFYNKFFPKYAAKAERILTVSEFSRQDIAQNYHIDSNKIDVVYNGISDGFYPRSEEKNSTTRKRFTKGKPYFLFVGSKHPRKNIPRLLKAFDLFKQRTSSAHQLVLCGPDFWGTKPIEDTYRAMKSKEDVVIAGRVEENDLQEIYSAAFALVYVPYFEGFGIPLAEAMASDIPIITSTISCMPEVCFDAALYVDPYHPEAIADAMIQLTDNENLRSELIEKGKARRQVFNWDIGAEKIWQTMLACIPPQTSS